MSAQDYVVFQGRLSQLAARIDAGEFVPKLQSSHSPPCKFWTAFAVINGIAHAVPIIHGPTGCTYSVASDFKLTSCEYRGMPMVPTTCTRMDESSVVYGGEVKLTQAIDEAVAKYKPQLVVVLSCCCPGISGDDVEMVAHEAGRRHNLEILAVRSEGFGGDFRSGHEDAFRALMELMQPPTEEGRLEQSVNILGARIGPTYTERKQDLDELLRILKDLDIGVNAVIAGGCTLEELRRAPQVAMNTSWCYDWGMKIGELMEERFGVPFSRTGLPYGLEATRRWVMGVAEPLGLAPAAEDYIEKETDRISKSLDTCRHLLKGRTALIEVAEFPGPIRALAMAKMVEEFGARAVVVNFHPYTVKERRPTVDFLISQGEDPELVLTQGLFSLGTFEASSDTEQEMRRLVATYDEAIYFGVPNRFPGVPVVNLTSELGMPQFGFTGITKIARMVKSAVDQHHRPRSRLFRHVLYGQDNDAHAAGCPHRRRKGIERSESTDEQ